MGGRTWDPNYKPGVDFFGPWFFKIHIKIYLDSSEGSNFILSSLEDGHFDKLP